MNECVVVNRALQTLFVPRRLIAESSPHKAGRVTDEDYLEDEGMSDEAFFPSYLVSDLTLSLSVCGLKDIKKLSHIGAVELYEAICASKWSELVATYLFEIRKFPGRPTPEVYLSEISAL